MTRTNGQLAAASAASLLDGVAENRPAWQQAQDLQRRAAQVGFDWNSPLETLRKLEEEVAELRAELENSASQARIEDEFGDVMFVIASLARHAKVNLAQVAVAGNRKFERRFRGMEALAAAQGTTLAELDRPAQMALWQQVKREGG